ncbi:MAG: aldehyde-activating protein, partial [Acidiferrobacteraceae bacterium]|nr:aldehyde-activating protein [Acidiferrobacteraceae bacterium]
MVDQFSGHCLCGAVQFQCSTEPMFQANCHCDDCRRSGGGVYASFAFVDASVLEVSGETHAHQH